MTREEDHHLYYTSCSDDDDGGGCENEEELNQEEWEDWNSQELLNVWMSIAEYHQEWYIPLRRTFHEFCSFVYQAEDDAEEEPPPEIHTSIRNHPFVKGLDWNYFFSLSYK
jgi:hypothetical protein